jgi:hypothetical protein
MFTLAEVTSWYESTGSPPDCAEIRRRMAGRSAGAHTSTADSPVPSTRETTSRTEPSSDSSAYWSMMIWVPSSEGRRPSSIDCSNSGSIMITCRVWPSR